MRPTLHVVPLAVVYMLSHRMASTALRQDDKGKINPGQAKSVTAKSNCC